MLNLFNLNLNKKVNKLSNEQEKYSKHYPCSTREWNNSIYVYNKNALNVIPQTAISSIKLIRSYFNIYNFELERKIRINRLLRRLRKLSSNRIYVSNGEFKHTNDKVVITLYLFNRQKHNYLLNIEKIYAKTLTRRSNRMQISKIFSTIRSKGLKSLKKANKDKFLLIKTLKTKEALSYKSLSVYITKFYKKVAQKSLDKLKLYLYYKQLLFINKSKFNYTYLQFLKKYLEKLYNKNVEFNLINLKRFYLNSDILSETLTLKIRKNRKKLLKYLNTIKRKVKTRNKKNLYYILTSNKSNLDPELLLDKNSTKKVVLHNLKYRHVTGFRLEANGRLTRRYTASKSISKVRYKGNLLNIDSSYNGLSSVLLKGNLRPNLQYTKLKSNTRIGSFGIKGWVSGN